MWLQQRQAEKRHDTFFFSFVRPFLHKWKGLYMTSLHSSGMSYCDDKKCDNDIMNWWFGEMTIMWNDNRPTLMSCTMWLGQGPSERTKVKAKTASNWNFCVVIAIVMISTYRAYHCQDAIWEIQSEPWWQSTKEKKDKKVWRIMMRRARVQQCVKAFGFTAKAALDRHNGL